MRKILALTVLLALVPCAAVARPAPSNEFVRQSLNALTSMPTVSAARWQDLGRRRPKALMGAIAAAERQGWKPTSTTAIFQKSRGDKRLRPIALWQDLYTSSGDGEMLVWNWDDGDPSTAEGTVWVHSFVTDNEVTFNVQLAGDTYDAMVIPYYEGVDAAVSEAWVTGTSAIGPAQAPRLMTAAAIRRVQSYDDHGDCALQGQAAGGRCLMRAAKDHLNEGVKGAAAGQLIGAAFGAMTGGLAGALAGAVGGTLPGFASGVLTSLIWGTDHGCQDEAWRAYYACINWYECERQHKVSCNHPLAEVTWARIR